MIAKYKIPYFIISLIILLPFLFGTEPLPAPYHQYRVFGNIERQSGGPKENYVVTLVGAFSNQPDTVIDITSYSSEDKSVTDTSGHFSLDVQSFFGKADSISIKVSAADKQPFISTKWLVPIAGASIMGEYRSAQEPGCSGCGTTEVSEPIVKGYLYTFQDQTVVIPD